MALSIQNSEKTSSGFHDKSINNHFRDSRAVSSLPHRHQRPAFSVISNQSRFSGWANDIEQIIADAFENKDITGLVSLLCKSDESPIYVRKTDKSPLYVYSSLSSIDETVKDKITLAETALYLMLKDETVEIKDIANAFQIFSEKNSIYNPPLKLTEEFHKRLGLFENIRKTDEIINKLREARLNLGF